MNPNWRKIEEDSKRVRKVIGIVRNVGSEDRPEITKEKVVKALKNMKEEEAPGEDEVTTNYDNDRRR